MCEIAGLKFTPTSALLMFFVMPFNLLPRPAEAINTLYILIYASLQVNSFILTQFFLIILLCVVQSSFLLMFLYIELVPPTKWLIPASIIGFIVSMLTAPSRAMNDSEFVPEIIIIYLQLALHPILGHLILYWTMLIYHFRLQ